MHALLSLLRFISMYLWALAYALFSMPAWADAGSAVSVGTVLQTLLSLLFILGLFVFSAYLLRKTRSGRGFGGNGPLRVVGGLMLGTRERVVLVEVGDTWLVVGISPGQMRTLHALPKGELSTTTIDEQPFGHWLKQIIERKHADK